ncbi:MAG: alpha/beta hydrolase [Parvularculaceae bacterium]|nr:alpha/beta hydrolase [Parvularculaceae bacterium]
MRATAIGARCGLFVGHKTGQGLTMLTIDPALFRPEAIAPETLAVNEKIETFLQSAPSIMDLGPVLVRELRAKGEGLLAKQPEHEMARWETAKALGLEVPVRVFKPAGDLRGVYLHIHGGGHTIGTADSQDQTLAELAQRAAVGVVSVEYRLAPENPWPLPADDCEAAAVWLFENAKDLFGTDKIVVGGESAGGHLSAVTVLRLRDNHQLAFAGANLVYGVFDCSETPSLRNWGDRNLILNTPIVRWFAEQLRSSDEAKKVDRKDPAISPLYADLTGLCPALFSVGTLDPIMDDTLFMAPRWLAAGNETELEIYPGGIHAFDMIPGLPIAAQHHERAASFVVKCLS